MIYIISVYDELEFDVYEKLIEYALSKSDAFMLVTYRYSDQRSHIPTPPDKALFDSEEEYLEFLNCYEEMKISYYKEVEKEKNKKKYIFKNSTEPFLKQIRPYLIKIRNFPTEWPSAKVSFLDDETSVDICIYRASNQVKEYLIESKGLFNWKYPILPEDLCFFYEGYCWFYTVAHEGYAYIYIESKPELERLREMGLDFRVSVCNEDQVNLFYENYKL